MRNLFFDDYGIKLSTMIALVITVFVLLAVVIIGGSIVAKERSCELTGKHYGVPSVYDRFQDTCYITVNGQKIDAKNYRVIP